MSDKVYWSHQPEEKWTPGDFLIFFLIPNKWWSIKAWKFAFSMRSAIIKKYMENSKDGAHE